jgi:hypothetical protein
MSWRDETPRTVQEDLDLLADEALSAATYLLGKQWGGFHPFGVRLPADAKPELVGADPGEGEHPATVAPLSPCACRTGDGGCAEPSRPGISWQRQASATSGPDEGSAR